MLLYLKKLPEKSLEGVAILGSMFSIVTIFGNIYSIFFPLKRMFFPLFRKVLSDLSEAILTPNAGLIINQYADSLPSPNNGHT